MYFIHIVRGLYASLAGGRDSYDDTVPINPNPDPVTPEVCSHWSSIQNHDCIDSRVLSFYHRSRIISICSHKLRP